MNYTGSHYIFEHKHNCERKGEQVSVRPPVENGVEYLTRPVCVEMNVELNEVHREVYPTPVEEDSNGEEGM